MPCAIDPRCNLWADTGRGYAVALEVGDPVESDSYPVSVSGKKITVSFALPRWFETNANSGDPCDFLGRVRTPFTMTKDGYVVGLKEGKVDQVYGEHYPEWRKATKRTDLAGPLGGSEPHPSSSRLCSISSAAARKARASATVGG